MLFVCDAGLASKVGTGKTRFGKGSKIGSD